ncbi:hypothetical protein LUZ60_017211 [Juncus effusus]|nr:hypothetical protein LUZ60_017211 [Juncus effusus]
MASKPLNLTLTIDKSTNRVVFAEADKDFVDILLSFLTLPLATVVGLANNKAPPCLNNLYKSLKDLSDEYVKPNPGKEILLSPNHGAELDCLDLKENIEGDRALTYYTCRQNCDAKLISPYSNTRCDCGGLMNRKVKLVRREKGRNENEGVFLKGLMRFIITDDFVIMPASTQAGLMLIGRLGREEMSNLQERTITVGQSEMLLLLEAALGSEMALTDAFLNYEEETQNE